MNPPPPPPRPNPILAAAPAATPRRPRRHGAIKDPLIPHDLRAAAPAHPICLDTLRAKNMQRQIKALPAPHETLHIVTRGYQDGFDTAHALLALADCPCDHMLLATLGMNDRNLAQMLSYLDSGYVRRMDVLVSQLFDRAEGRELGRRAKAQLTQRGGRYFAWNNHAKIIALKLTDGRTYTVMGSANLTSCHAIEAIAIFAHPDIFHFHRQWIETLTCPQKRQQAKQRPLTDPQRRRRTNPLAP